MSKPSSRMPCENVSFTLGLTPNHPGHPVIASLVYDDDSRLNEVVIVEAGKIGHGVQILLAELGVKLSRAIQHRDPETGEPL